MVNCWGKMRARTYYLWRYET